jgi:hypothetical protein
MAHDLIKILVLPSLVDSTHLHVAINSISADCTRAFGLGWSLNQKWHTSMDADLPLELCFAGTSTIFRAKIPTRYFQRILELYVDHYTFRRSMIIICRSLLTLSVSRVGIRMCHYLTVNRDLLQHLMRGAIIGAGRST